MAHTQFTSEQRYQIRALMQTNQPPTIIAQIVGVDRSTIYRELKRNTGQRGYRPKQAHEKALARRQGKSKERITPETWARDGRQFATTQPLMRTTVLRRRVSSARNAKNWL